MMKQTFKKLISPITVLVFGLLFTSSIFAQGVLKGTVSDTQGVGIPGSSVVVVGTNIGSATTGDGSYNLKLANGTYDVKYSSVGYSTVTKSITINGETISNVILDPSATSLDEVVISVGSRGSQRTITDTPLPIDIIGATELKGTGQTTFDKALTYRVPSFNSVNTPVNDATSLLDPYEIRNRPKPYLGAYKW